MGGVQAGATADTVEARCTLVVSEGEEGLLRRRKT